MSWEIITLLYLFSRCFSFNKFSIIKFFCSSVMELYKQRSWHSLNVFFWSLFSCPPSRLCVKLHLRDGRTDGRIDCPSVRLLDGVWNERTDRRTDAANYIRGVCPSVRPFVTSSRSDVDTAWRRRSWLNLLPCVFVRQSVRSLQTLSKRRTDGQSIRPSVRPSLRWSLTL